jgi:hypothetical protein
MRSLRGIALVLVLGGVGASTVFDVAAQTRREVREQAEASMVLTGEIDIGTEGQVEAFRLDKRAQVDETIVTFVEGAVKTWRFAPMLVNGQAAKARTPATIRLGAKNNPDGTGLITLLAANFETYDETSTDNVTKVKMSPPMYPEDVLNARGRGDVLLLVQVGRDGKVLDVATEQVSLRVIANEAIMRKMRDKLARVSMGAARKWTFKAPSTGNEKDEASWTVRVPVRFSFGDEVERYGRWDAYIPGPRQQAPWRRDMALSADANADLLPAGGVFMADATSKGPKLLTPLGG